MAPGTRGWAWSRPTKPHPSSLRWGMAPQARQIGRGRGGREGQWVRLRVFRQHTKAVLARAGTNSLHMGGDRWHHRWLSVYDRGQLQRNLCNVNPKLVHVLPKVPQVLGDRCQVYRGRWNGTCRGYWGSFHSYLQLLHTLLHLCGSQRVGLAHLLAGTFQGCDLSGQRRQPQLDALHLLRDKGTRQHPPGDLVVSCLLGCLTVGYPSQKVIRLGSLCNRPHPIFQGSYPSKYVPSGVGSRRGEGRGSRCGQFAVKQ